MACAAGAGCAGFAGAAAIGAGAIARVCGAGVTGAVFLIGACWIGCAGFAGAAIGAGGTPGPANIAFSIPNCGEPGFADAVSETGISVDFIFPENFCLRFANSDLRL